VTVLAAGELARDAGAHELIRLRVAAARPGLAMGEWRLLAGDEVRPDRLRVAPPELRYVSDVRIQWGVASPERAIALLGRLDENAALDGPHGDAVRRLRAARSRGDVAGALAAGLALAGEHRAAAEVVGLSRPLESDGVTVEGDAIAAARRLAGSWEFPLRSATVHQPVFSRRPALLLESDEVEGALRWALGGDAARAGLAVEVVTPRLAEDAWRSRGLRWLSVAGGAHLAGDPLAERVRLPGADVLGAVARYGAVTAIACARWAAIGRRSFAPDVTVPARLAAYGAVAAGEAVPAVLPGPSGELVRALEAWRSARGGDSGS
jgi:hypothetical protein